MEYVEIIKHTCEKCAIKWWPQFAFHSTDVTNAVSILSSGYLYSRIKASELRLMRNDNASPEVINMTESAALSNVRFYFRPLTPTQYYNEGFKHPQIRYDGQENANMPVPIFLLFDLDKLLKLPQTRFSELAQAGHGAVTFSGVEAFSKLNFSNIYSNGYVDDDVRAYRHAELLYPDAFPIEGMLRYVLCRNEIEKTTLMNLLRRHSSKAFYEYKNIIRVCRKDLFEKNGLLLDAVAYAGDSVSFSFADTYSKRKYEMSQMKAKNLQHLPPLHATFRFEWLNGWSAPSLCTNQ